MSEKVIKFFLYFCNGWFDKIVIYLLMFDEGEWEDNNKVGVIIYYVWFICYKFWCEM